MHRNIPVMHPPNPQHKMKQTTHGPWSFSIYYTANSSKHQNSKPALHLD